MKKLLLVAILLSVIFANPFKGFSQTDGLNDLVNNNEISSVPANIIAPSITDFTPKTAKVGETVTITGTDFTGTTLVTFGSKVAQSFTVVSPTTITVVIGIYATSGDVSVTSPGGTSSKAGFTLIPQPGIYNATPLLSAAGDEVTITGINFTDVTNVTFGNTPAASFKVISATTIKAVVGTGSSGEIKVTAPGGSSTYAYFTFVGPPTISSFSPLTAAANARIVINGTNFYGVKSVTIGGNPVGFLEESSTRLNVFVDENTKNGSITLTNIAGSVTSAGSFTLIPPPTITSVIPLTATKGDVVTITGTNFNGPRNVTFGGASVQTTYVSSTTVTAIIGRQGASGKVSVTFDGGTAEFPGFTYIPPVPKITAISPPSARPGDVVDISGENLENVTAVSFGGVPAASFRFESFYDNTISAVVRQGATGSVSVTTPGGVSTKAGFTFIPVPFIESFSPTTAKSGDIIQITGYNFTDVNLVIFGGAGTTAFTVTSPTTMTAVVGAISSSGKVEVFNARGSTSKTGFIFVTIPVIAQQSPVIFTLGASTNLTVKDYNNLYTYQWYKDGTAIPSATSATLTATLSGVYTVNCSNGGVTQVSSPVTLYAGLPENNFKVAATSTTCKGSNNGSLSITAVQQGDYTATVTNSGGSTIYSAALTSPATVSNLVPGTYNVCISANKQPASQQCFSVKVTEPKDLTLYTTINKQNNSVDLALSGADVYNIEVNGVKTTNNTGFVTLALNQGVNNILVTTDKACQGAIAKRIVISDDISAYPNPFTNSLTLDLGKKAVGNAVIEIYNSSGKMVYRQKFANKAGTVDLDLANLPPSQVYVLKLTADENEFINKIVKK